MSGQNATYPEVRAMHRIVVIAVAPVTAFDLSIPELIFSKVEVDGQRAYDVRVCAAEPGVLESGGPFDVCVREGLDAVADADTVMVTGGFGREDVPATVLDTLRAAAAAGKRVASICTGAFVLAEAGLLEGRRATTYWAKSELFRRRYPSVTLEPDVLFVDDGMVLTSAGLAAGIDLCLHMVRSDLGAAAANTIARLAVVAPVRPGGQAQFIQTPLPDEAGLSLSETRAWALQRLDQPLSLTDLARHARCSVRTLTRRFQAETGLSPLQWLLHQRIDRALELLEATELPMTTVAAHSGMGSVDSMRQHLARRVGLTPTAYRRSFTRL
jgi:transcriptional regulator GlxA family with amidase domain